MIQSATHSAKRAAAPRDQTLIKTTGSFGFSMEPVAAFLSLWGGPWLTSDRPGRRKLVITAADAGSSSRRHRLPTFDSAEGVSLNHPHIFPLAPGRERRFISRCFSRFPRHDCKQHFSHIALNRECCCHFASRRWYAPSSCVALVQHKRSLDLLSPSGLL